MQSTHIPFKGSAEVQPALLGGHLQFTAGDFNVSLIEAGQTRLLLLLTEDRRAENPQTPILKDIGYDIPYPAMTSVSGPRGLPEGILKKLEEALTKAMNEPPFIKGMKELRLTVVHRSTFPSVSRIIILRRKGRKDERRYGRRERLNRLFSRVSIDIFGVLNRQRDSCAPAIIIGAPISPRSFGPCAPVTSHDLTF